MAGSKLTKTRWSGESAFDREMNAALAEDAVKLEAMGQDPGPTLEDLDAPCMGCSPPCGFCPRDFPEQPHDR